MKKILIMVNHMGIGGVEKTLLSLLSTIDSNKYSVELLLVNKRGQLLEYIPEYVKVKTLEIPNDLYNEIFYGRMWSLKNNISKGMYTKIPIILYDIINNSFRNKHQKRMKLYNKLNDVLLEYPQNFDIALDFMGYASFSTFYVAQKVNAKVKATWLHSELSKSNANLRAYHTIYEKYNKFFGVSRLCVKEFQADFPELGDKSEVFYNIISTSLIREMSIKGKSFVDNFDGIRILTVGRLSFEKGYDIAIKTLKELIDEGYKVRWYAVGEGPEYDNLTKLIKSYQLEGSFILLGADANPYGYMKDCDIYVQPSRYEGYSTTTNEARTLCKAIITTDVSGADEQFIHEVTGLIVGCNVGNLKSAIIDLVTNENKRIYFSENLSKLNIDTSYEVEKLYSIIT